MHVAIAIRQQSGVTTALTLTQKASYPQRFSPHNRNHQKEGLFQNSRMKTLGSASSEKRPRIRIAPSALGHPV
jgi:hypothetical protein